MFNAHSQNKKCVLDLNLLDVHPSVEMSSYKNFTILIDINSLNVHQMRDIIIYYTIFISIPKTLLYSIGIYYTHKN